MLMCRLPGDIMRYKRSFQDEPEVRQSPDPMSRKHRPFRQEFLCPVRT